EDYSRYYRQTGDVLVDSADLDTGTVNALAAHGRSCYIDSLSRHREDLRDAQAVATLCFQVVKMNGALHLYTTWRKHLFDASEMRQLADFLVWVVEEMVADPQRRIGEILAQLDDSLTRLRAWTQRHLNAAVAPTLTSQRTQSDRVPFFTECQRVNPVKQG